MLNLLPVNYETLNEDGFFATGSGNIISVAQEVEHFEQGEGLLISVAQTVALDTSGLLISIVQVVTSATPSTWFTRNGWDADIYINGVFTPKNQIHGNLEIKRTENAAAQCTFTIIPPRGVQNLTSYEGKTVIINVRTADDGLVRAYTGKINIPDIDLIQRKITITCTDNRRELINTTFRGYMPSVGYYSNAVFGVPQDTASELDNRLSTTPLSVNFDAYGSLKLASSFAKATPDFTFPENKIRRENGLDPKVLLTPRANIVNTVNVNVVYRYQRMYHKEAFYTWDSDYANTPCSFMINGYSVAKRSMIESAIQGTGWPISGDVGYEPVIPAGFYSCPTSTGVRKVGVSWTQTQYVTVNVTRQVPTGETEVNGSGEIVPVFTSQNVVDEKGNNVVQSVPVAAIDLAPQLCFGAEFNLTKRFSQNVEENYTCVLSAPQSVTRFGTVAQNETVSIDSTFDSSKWDNYTGYTDPPSGRTIVRSGSSSSYFFNETENLATYQNAMSTILNRAKTTILKSHRDNRVIFNTFLKPTVELHHTVELDAESPEGTIIQCKGKVYEITHMMNCSTGDCNTKIELALSLASGSATDTTLAAPARPTNSLFILDDVIFLQSHYGEEPQLDWTGFIGNRYITARTANGTTDYRKTNYPESFVIDTPTINAAYTNNLTLPKSATYSVQLISDDLTVEL